MPTINLKTFIACMIVAVAGCHSEENKKLERKLDSVNHELENTRQVVLDARQVEAILDSIDESRRMVYTQLSNASDTKNNVTRLNDINAYIKDINVKIDQMEKSIKYVNTMAASILKLQEDIDVRTKKIAKLEIEEKKLSGKNSNLALTVHRKDSTLAVFVKTCEEDIQSLEKLMENIHQQNNLITAELYFKQAEALDKAAENMTSSGNRKITKREALEMYRISFSLGKPEASAKIKNLEKYFN